jgi:hypothetical protein
MVGRSQGTGCPNFGGRYSSLAGRGGADRLPAETAGPGSATPRGNRSRGLVPDQTASDRGRFYPHPSETKRDTLRLARDRRPAAPNGPASRQVSGRAPVPVRQRLRRGQILRSTTRLPRSATCRSPQHGLTALLRHGLGLIGLAGRHNLTVAAVTCRPRSSRRRWGDRRARVGKRANHDHDPGVCQLAGRRSHADLLSFYHQLSDPSLPPLDRPSVCA